MYVGIIRICLTSIADSCHVKHPKHVSTSATWPGYEILAETIACQKAMNAIVSAVVLVYVTKTPKATYCVREVRQA